jgi:Raf kinase inhibitor-like YbhB/YbcL family protein
MMKLLVTITLLALLALTAACGDDDGNGEDNNASPSAAETDETEGADDPTEKAEEGGLQVTSTEFEDGGEIPVEFTCSGDDIAPPISWAGIPEDTQSIALIMDDPDANDFVHWVVFDIPSKVTGFGVTPEEPDLPSGAKQALNDADDAGYSGPCPPEGEEHTYSFRVYALDAMLDLEGGIPAADAIAAIEEAGQLDQGELTGTFAKE